MVAKGVLNLCSEKVYPTGILLLLLVTFSCSKSTDPGSNKPPDNGPVGILLSGSESDSALSGTTNHGPYAVPENEWDGDFVTTRLEAVINRSATVGTVNAALNVVGAKISCMRPNMMFTELVISPVSDSAEANAICSTLTATGAFSVAFPCFRPADVNERPPQPAGMITGNLEMQGITAAWNARDHLENNAQSVLVIVSDQFYGRAPHTQVAALSFPTTAGSPTTAVDTNGFAIGNHGFMVAGTIGANNDALGATGVFPDQTHLLRIHGVPMGGFASWTALLYDLADAFPASGNFVLNSSYGYGGDFRIFPRERRIIDALFWRSLVAERQTRFLHTQAAGNTGWFSPTLENADWNSPIALASRFDTPTQMLQGNPVTPAWEAQLQSIYDTFVASRPAVATKLTNVLVVGSSNSSGDLTDFSSGPSDLRMVSETHPVPCAVADNECTLNPDNFLMGLVDGTSFAAPQVAGLAAYLMALDNSLSMLEIKQILMANYNYKWIDAYKAVLSIDKSLAVAPIRVALLDISDAPSSTGNPGPFNEVDLQTFLDSLKEYQTNRLSTTPPYATDYSRCDLNGNGYTGDSALPNPYMPFDLDVNTPPMYSSVDVIICDRPSAGDTILDESALTDRDILLYYAYSPLYSGDKHVRDSLFNRGCSPFVLYNASYKMNYYFETHPSLSPVIQDSSSNYFLQKTISIRELGCSNLATYVFNMTATCEASYSSSSNNTALNVHGISKSKVSGIASLENDQGTVCDYWASLRCSSYSVIQFSLSEELDSVPFSLSVNAYTDRGDINAGNQQAWVVLQSIDANGLPDGGVHEVWDSQLLPPIFAFNGTLVSLPAGHRYELFMRTTTAEKILPKSDPGPDSSAFDAGIWLHVGP